MYDAILPYAGAKMVKSRSTRLVGSKQMNPRVASGNYEVAHISYELNVLGARYGFAFLAKAWKRLLITALLRTMD